MPSVVSPTPAAAAPQPLWSRLLPHLLAVALLLVLAVLYFSPIVFGGKTLSQHDIVQFNGGAREALLFRENTGQEALWTNSMFAGMPTYLISTRFPGDMSVYLTSLFTFGLPPVVANLFAALFCGYLLFASLGMRPVVSLVGAIAIGFTSYNLIILAAGHNSKSYALAYAPLVLAGLLVTFRRDRLIGGVLFALGLTMNVRANHLQITYYLLLLVLVFGVVELIYAVREGRLAGFLKNTAVLALGPVLAVGVSFGRLYTTAEWGKYSIRGKSELKTAAPAQPGQAPAPAAEEGGSGLDHDYAFSYSYGVGETITLLIPNYYGGASTGKLDADSNTGKALSGMVEPGQLEQYLAGMPTYWGEQPITSGPVYVGAVVVLLFVLGVFVADRRTRTWLLAATILSIMLAWGKNFASFNDLMFDFFPGYNKFRAVSMALTIAQLAMPLLAVLALARVLRARPAASAAPLVAGLPVAQKDTPEVAGLRRHLLMAAGITAGLCVLALVFGLGSDFAGPVDSQLPQGFPLDALRQDRAALMRTDVFRSIFFIVAAAGVLWFYLGRKLSLTMAASLVGLLTLADLWTADKRYLGENNFTTQTITQQFTTTKADEQILADKTLHYRVLNLSNPFNDAQTSYLHKSIGGYHGAKLRRYQELIERQISPEMQQMFQQLQSSGQVGNPRVLNMLNTRYLITPPQQNGETQAIPNAGALGNAWFVSQVQPVQTPDQEIAALSAFDPATTAVVDVRKFPQPTTTYNPAGSTIQLTSYSPNELKYAVDAAANELAVFSEIYYADGWNAYIDGQLTPHLRANYVLRALPIPAGKHTVEFKFEPKAYTLGNTVSMVSSGLLFLVIIGGVVYVLRRRPAPAASTDHDELLAA
jgi:Bacterial membrane protein YfhO